MKKLNYVQTIRFAKLDSGETYSFHYNPNRKVLDQLQNELEVLSINSLVIQGKLYSNKKSEWTLQANFRASITQACIKTSKPIKNVISTKFLRRYVSDKQLLNPLSDNKIPVDDDLELLQPEIELFEIAHELLFLEKPPYPSKSGSEFKFTDVDEKRIKEQSDSVQNPFAKLKDFSSRTHQKTN